MNNSHTANDAQPWLSQYDYWVPAQSSYPQIPVDRLLDRATMRFPDHVATIFFGQKLTYLELNSQVNTFAAGLQALGIEKGDRVGLMLPNCPQFAIAYYAALRIGAVVVNVNPLYTPHEIGFVLNETAAVAAIVLDQAIPALEKALAAEQLPALKHLIAASIAEYMPPPVAEKYIDGLRAQKQVIAAELPATDGTHLWAAFMSQADPKTLTRATIDASNDLAVLQFTGGTTGTPKGAMLTHFNLVANAVQGFLWGREYLIPGETIYLSVIPFFHVYGMSSALNACVMIGGSQILVPRFDPENIFTLIKTFKPTCFPGVPTMYIGLLNHPLIHQADLSSLQIMISGSAPLPKEVGLRFQKFCSGVFAEGYGLSEASPSTHCNPLFNDQRAGSIGLPLPDTLVKVVDATDGHELAFGEVGEVIVSGPQVMKGYYNRPEETSQALRQRDDGRIWLHTGDIGHMDTDGYFYLVDRKKDLILVSGFNVYPREIEEVLFTHPAVREAAVIGVPEEYRGEAVKAFVVLKPEMTVTEADLIAYCRERLAGYKTPSSVAFLDQLPRTVVGKVLRTELRRQEAEASQPESKPL